MKVLWGLCKGRSDRSVSELKSGKHYNNFPCWLLAAWSNTEVLCTVSLVALVLVCLIYSTWYVRDSAVDLRGKSVSQCVIFRKVGKRQSFHLKWSVLDTGMKNWFRSEAFIWSYPLFYVLEWIVGHLFKEFFISNADMGIWERKSYYQWTDLELVGVNLPSENLNLSYLKELLWNYMPVSKENADWFLLHSESNVFIGNASHRLWWEGMLSLFRKQKFTIFSLAVSWHLLWFDS